MSDPTVLIDTREATNHPLWLDDSDGAVNIPGTWRYEGYIPTPQLLPYGDVRLELPDEARAHWLTIEIKTWRDLLATLRDRGSRRSDTRIRHQMEGLLGLRMLGHEVCLLIIGLMTPAGGKKRKGIYVTEKGKRRLISSWTWSEIQGALLAIQHMGVMVTFAESAERVPHAASIAANVCAQAAHFGDPGLAQVATLRPALDSLATTFTAVDKIGPDKAIALAEHCFDFPTFWTMTPAQLGEIKGIGKVMAQRIWDHFHGEREGPRKLVDVFSDEFNPEDEA